MLFIIVLEVLLKKIRQDNQIRGIAVGEKRYKLRAFADDVMITTENPLQCTPRILECINEYGRLAGFKLNYGKTKILVKNMEEKDKVKLQEITGLEIKKKIRYLGINLTTNTIDLSNENYGKTWNEIKNDLQVWGKLNLSLLGKISVIKMNILPRMMFLFQSIPILGGDKCFNNWKRDLAKFIWSGKKPRIKHKIMIDKKERGGFGLPDMELYHDAVGLTWLKEWIKLDDSDVLDLEGVETRFGWHAYLIDEKVRVHKGFLGHIIRKSIYKIWEKYKRLLEPKTPWWASPAEIVAVKKLNMKENWATYKTVLKEENGELELKDYTEIKAHISDWFQYIQIKYRLAKDKKVRI
uniref:Reverse transcriptase domain-containing protein n=1 Tax=Podarcis muralis TaxID=64176 RepID=A0A670JFR1_PODMU